MVTGGKLRCSLQEKPSASGTGSNAGMVASLAAAAWAATTITAGPAMALVDERLSTEGTGLPFGLSNNLLGWILLVCLASFGLSISFTLQAWTRMTILGCPSKPRPMCSAGENFA
ncbi:hypothetical protein SLA2020_451840 [Shorea laevis]